MARFVVLAVVLLAAVACNAGPSARIIGGEDTTIEYYTELVQVEFLGLFTNTWSQSCAGIILNSRHIMSAAQCFDGVFYSNEYRRIRAGTSYRNTGGVIAYVEREFNHPTYGENAMDGDITVVRLIEPLEYSPVVQQGVIVAQGSVISDNVPVVHAGWGSVDTQRTEADQLQDVTIYTINNDLCRERYLDFPNHIVTTNMICAGILDVGGKDACQGDSGGPLYYNKIVIGVTSWRHTCANETYPGVSTAVSSYTNWIISVVEG